MREMYKDCFNENVRVDQIIHIGASLGDSSVAISENLQEFFNNDQKEIEKTIGESFKNYCKNNQVKEFDNIEGETISDFALTCKVEGFLVYISTPNYTYYKDGGSKYSWEYYKSQWFYGETYEVAIDKGFKWVESVRKTELLFIKEIKGL